MWWLQPVSQALGLMLLGAYATWAALQGEHYLLTVGGRDYLSPFYSPLLKPSWWPFSPAILVLGAPMGFRTTCYYYRKAYYRAFFADPPACAVGEPRGAGYTGESKFPFILQNLHRYFLYLAMPILVFLWWDVVRAFTIDGAFGIGGGSLVILASTTFLTLYTFSCHSLRHLIGGRLDCFSCVVAGESQRKLWSGASWLNGHHMAWAWWSLFAVCFADFYVRMCSMGLFNDPILMTFKQLFSTAGGVGL
ncbi:MAG: succinate dehydrogenase [Candidatus Eisenbacteria bacterium]|uniref:Succinate dehydrogenase n=1 Tax=Eiseniibacteriota bacterium TaxID=2212470 RepID=A0A849SBZ1_UNCEI|nr:succinate dehydrogenase [Candidatus Eisenbacteria bacterium]